MTNLHKALYGFWSSFRYNGAQIAAYLSGHVPDGAAFPYITFEVVFGEFDSANVLTAHVWCKAESGVNVNAQCAAILDEIAESIPNGSGTRLIYPGGMAMLFRNSAGFLSYTDDPEDPDIIGGRISYEIHFYQGR